MNGFEYLKKASERGSKLGLERINELCSRLGQPQDKLPVIHIAGTNGKGSFGAMISAILRDSGYKTGSFSSPALMGVTDSFRINGERISDSEFDSLICGIMPVCETMTDKPTEFEVLTAAAYELFVQKNCDIAVIECGMGGDTDSTNVVNSSLLSVITNVAVDHTSFLGDTVKEIAAHKAGIIKKSRPVLYGGNNDEVYEIIAETAAKNGSELTVTDHSRITSVSYDIFGTEVVFGGKKYAASLTGKYQRYNIANVLTAVELLRKNGLNIPEDAVISGLLTAKLSGRFEIVSKDPPIIFDGAHNPDGIVQAAESIKACLDGKVVLLVGVMADKEYSLYPQLLGEFAEAMYTVKPDNPRALDSETLAEAFSKYGIKAIPCKTVKSGIASALEYAENRNIPLVALGSLYLYDEFITELQKIFFELQ